MKYTRKTDHTRQQIIDSLLDNMATTDFEKITVNDLVTPIFLDRSTFYRYFDDKYDLLDQIEQQVLSAITSRPAPPSSAQLNDEVLAQAAHFFETNRSILSILLGPHGMPSFEQRLKREMSSHFQQLFLQHETPNTELTILSDLLITMVIHTLKTWVLGTDDINLTETLILLRSVIDHGIYDTVQKYRH